MLRDALSAPATTAEVRPIDFDLTRRDRRLAFTFFSDARSDFEKDHGDALTLQAAQVGGIGDGQIEREEAQELAEFLAEIRERRQKGFGRSISVVQHPVESAELL